MEMELGQPVNVVNRTGGSGVVGHAAIAQAPADGYTIGLITVEIAMMHWQGLTELTPSSYTPIALVNADPAGVQVAADAPYKNVKELLAAIKAGPLYKLVEQKRALRSAAWMKHVGYTREKTVKPEPLGAAEADAAKLQEKIDALRRHK